MKKVKLEVRTYDAEEYDNYFEAIAKNLIDEKNEEFWKIENRPEPVIPKEYFTWMFFDVTEISDVCESISMHKKLKNKNTLTHDCALITFKNGKEVQTRLSFKEVEKLIDNVS